MNQKFAYNAAGLLLVATGAALALMGREPSEYLVILTTGTTVLGRGPKERA